MKKRICSMLLALVLVFGMIPTTSLTVSAAAPSEALTMSIGSGKYGRFTYSNNLQLYFKYNNYIYKAVFTNLKNISKFDMVYTSDDNEIFISSAGRLSLVQTPNTYNQYANLNQLPTKTGISVSFYLQGSLSSYAKDITKSVVTFTCMGVGTPTWTWNDTSSAEAKFTSTDNGATLTVGAKISSSTTPATSCVNKDKTTYTAKVTVYGTEYTNTKTVDGAVGSHSLTYTASGNVITESCKNNCGHSETATLKVKNDADLSYTGSAKEPLEVSYSSGWQGEKNASISYSKNTDVGQGSGSITISGAKATQNFTITNGTMTGIAADKVSVPYDGNPHSITVKNVPTGATVTYSTDGKTYSKTNPTFIGIGTNTVYYKVEKANYDTVTGSATVIISQAQNSWTTEPSIEGWTYGEDAKTPNKGTPKFGSDVKVEYKLATEDDNQYSTIVPTNAGNYKVRFSVEGNANYTALSKEVDLTIAKKKITVTADDKSKTYGETDPTLTWKLTEGTLVQGDELTGISVSRVTGEDATTYTITASQINGANLNYDITFVDGTFTINKKAIGINWGNTDFTYNGDPKLPTATATGVIGNDEIGLTVDGGQINAGTGYTATVTGITGDKAKNYQLPADVTTTFNIAKADQSAPSGLVGTPEDIDERENGTITGVTSAMEYRKNDETSYTAITDTELTNLADGTYYIRYKADSNHNASSETKVVLSNDKKLQVTVPATLVGYTLIADKTALVWQEDVTLTFTLKEGYSKLDNFAVKVNGTTITLDNDGKYTKVNVTENLTVTVEGVADITAPTAEITLGKNKWNEFFNTITFGLFFKETQTVTITATDMGSGVEKIYYYLSTTELTEEQVKALPDSDWTEYTGAFRLNPQDEYIIYAKAVDKDNNAKYISSDKTIVIDNIAPVIFGIADGETHYGDTTFEVTDKHIDEVKVDGNPVTLVGGKYTITADGQEHTVAVNDKAKNSTTVKIKVITIASLDDDIESITTDNVKSNDKKAIEDVQSFVNGLIAGGKDFTDAEDTELANIKANTEALLNKIASVSAEMSNLDSSVKAYDINKVKSDDKAAINGPITRIDVLLNGNNLTENEKAEMTALKTTAQGLVKRIDDTAKKVTDLTEDVNAYDKDKVTSDDKQDIMDLVVDIDKLLDGDNLNDSEKDELKKVKDTATALIEKIEEAIGSTDTDNTDKVKDITSDNVETKDKSDLEKAKDDLEKALEDYKDNLTDDEKKDIQDEINRIEKALEVIDKVEKVEDLINKLPANIAKSDADAIKKADEAYNALTKYEQSILDKNAKKKLDNAKSALEALNKATNSPATGDTGNIWMWFALLFVSGGGLLGTTAYRRKRKETEN